MDYARNVTSETFSIIQSLCRVGLGLENQAFRHQVARLRENFASEGAKEEAAALDRLLRAASRAAEMQPSRVTTSQIFAATEMLTAKTGPPVDRETGAPLADILY